MEISKQSLLEISNRRSIIRKLVSDVVTIYKENEEGEEERAGGAAVGGR